MNGKQSLWEASKDYTLLAGTNTKKTATTRNEVCAASLSGLVENQIPLVSFCCGIVSVRAVLLSLTNLILVHLRPRDLLCYVRCRLQFS